MKMARPKICMIDMPEVVVSTLRELGYDCSVGSLGSEVRLAGRAGHETRNCLLNCSFPSDLHEHDIVILDSRAGEPVQYKAAEHTPTRAKDPEVLVFDCPHPQKVFDPRPYGAAILQGKLSDFMKKPSVLIAFARHKEEVDYHLIKVTPSGRTPEPVQTFDTYSFLPNAPSIDNLAGSHTDVVTGYRKELVRLLQKHNPGARYEVVVAHPLEWDAEKNESVKDKTFTPLMVNSQGRIVSYASMADKCIVLLFPRIREQAEFLTELLQSVLPDMLPALFPYSTRFAWIKEPTYQLPNEQSLRGRKETVKLECAGKLAAIDQEIAKNYENYKFLHDLLTETSAALVKAVEMYFKWLGFSEIINLDESKPDLLEEDLQVVHPGGLLVVEVKGIGGTSTDADCSQVDKIKHRRCKERGKFDVSALYVVNHQRYLPPVERSNPPFTAQQILDASSNERGLLTTFDLFRLNAWIETGLVTKEDARTALLTPGLVKFHPSAATHLGSPLSIHHNGTVITIDPGRLTLRIGDTLLIQSAHGLRDAHVLEIQVDGASVKEASGRPLGLKLGCFVSARDDIWHRSGEKV